MNHIIALLNLGFYSSSALTPEFKSFSTKFRNAITKEIQSVGATLVSFNRGHFECSGFFKFPDGQHYWFRIGDVRMWSYGDSVFGRMLMRTAKHEKDYTGGQNCFVELKTGMLSNWFRKFAPQHIPNVSFADRMQKVIGQK